MDLSKIFTKDEVQLVLQDIRRRAAMARGTKMTLIIFRLSCCCGLRCKEIRGLKFKDLRLEGDRPMLRVRKEITKGRDGKRKARVVPLWWDRGTLEDLRRHKEEFGQDPEAYVIHSLRKPFVGQPLGRIGMADRWERAIRILGPRAKELSIHKGRHTFISHALDSGRKLPAVRDAAGHSSVAMTSRYLHALDDGNWGEIFPEK